MSLTLGKENFVQKYVHIYLGETNDVLWHHSLTSKKDLLQNEFCILLKQTIAGFCF